MPERLDEPAFHTWVAAQGLKGPERLKLGVLVIRETVDDGGLLRDCVLERRRGAVDGPFYGDPARVEFTGGGRALSYTRDAKIRVFDLNGRAIERRETRILEQIYARHPHLFDLDATPAGRTGAAQ